MEEHLSAVWQAFLDLSTDRQVGMGGASTIPWTAINDYAIRYGIVDLDEFEWFSGLLRVMDNAWMERQAELNKED